MSREVRSRPEGSNPRQGGPNQVKIRAQRRSIWAPLKGKYGSQAQWTFLWENDNASPPTVLPQPWGQKGQGWCFHSTASLLNRAVGTAHKWGARTGTAPLWLRQGRRSQAFSGSPGLGGTDRSMSVLQTHTPGGEPGPSCRRECRWRPGPAPPLLPHRPVLTLSRLL